ncbi:MAG: hypothetical protein WC509_03385 [Candidatus Izemoplasmatales bacterium]
MTLEQLLKKFPGDQVVNVRTKNGELFKGTINDFWKSSSISRSAILPISDLDTDFTELTVDRKKEIFPMLVVVLDYEINFSAPVQPVKA